MDKNTTGSYLTFLLKNELFAISVHKVLEIIETDEDHYITHLPKAPQSISGVVNFRGNVIPVVNTRLKFDFDDYNPDEKFVIIVLQLKINNQEHIIGAKSDKVVDVIEISENEIKEIPAVGKGYNSEFINGVIHTDNRFVMLLNLEAAMGTDEIIQLKTDVEVTEEEENLTISDAEHND